MEWDKFKKQKLDDLNKAIKENKVDADMIPLIKLINKNKKWVTTSTCYGRIVLLEYDFESGKKESKFHSKWHSKIEAEKVEMSILRHGMKKQLWFKVEPFILHVATKDVKSALDFLGKIRECGIKRGGIQSISKKVMIEVQGHSQMIIPVNQVEGKWTEIVEIANQMMDTNAKALERIGRKLLKLKP